MLYSRRPPTCFNFPIASKVPERLGFHLLCFLLVVCVAHAVLSLRVPGVPAKVNPDAPLHGCMNNVTPGSATAQAEVKQLASTVSL